MGRFVQLYRYASQLLSIIFLIIRIHLGPVIGSTDTKAVSVSVQEGVSVSVQYSGLSIKPKEQKYTLVMRPRDQNIAWNNKITFYQLLILLARSCSGFWA